MEREEERGSGKVAGEVFKMVARSKDTYIGIFD